MQVTLALPCGSQPTTIKIARRRSLDARLLDLVATGDQDALKILFNRHSDLLYRFVLRLAGDPSLAEDVVSEVFLDVWRRPGNFRSESRVSTWLLAIARRKTGVVRRRRSALPWNEVAALSIVDPADSPEQCLDKQKRSAMLEGCLRQLAPIHREVIDLVYYQEKSVAEAAEIIGIPLNTVKTRMFHARSRMGYCLRQAGVHSITA